MSNTDLQLFETIAKMTQNQLKKSMKNFLKKMYPEENIIVTKDYILCRGDIPILLCAHMDTVFKIPPSEIYYDTRKRVMWSPQGLGADDRAGVFAIMKLVQRGFKPHIALLTDEEIGGIGAMRLVTNSPSVPFDIKYAIELDRQGECDCVFYSCDNEDFEKFVEGYGFVTDWGTFSDISTICPAWKCAGVNLSVGYLREHSTNETLNTNVLYSTISKVAKMLSEVEQATTFEYIPNKYDLYYGKLARAYGCWPGMDDEDYDYYYKYGYGGKAGESYSSSWTRPYDVNLAASKRQCINCQRIFSDDDVFAVKSRKWKGARNYYCLDCIGVGINWCEKCGEPFEVDTSSDNLCHDCAGKELPMAVAL